MGYFKICFKKVVWYSCIGVLRARCQCVCHCAVWILCNVKWLCWWSHFVDLKSFLHESFLMEFTKQMEKKGLDQSRHFTFWTPLKKSSTGTFCYSNHAFNNKTLNSSISIEFRIILNSSFFGFKFDALFV